MVHGTMLFELAAMEQPQLLLLSLLTGRAQPPLFLP